MISLILMALGVVYTSGYIRFLTNDAKYRNGMREIMSNEEITKFHQEDRNHVHDVIRAREFMLSDERPECVYGELIEFQLFDEETVLGDVKQCIQRAKNGATWMGSIRLSGSTAREDVEEDNAVGDFTLSCEQDSCVGTINLWTEGKEFVIVPSPNSEDRGIFSLLQFYASYRNAGSYDKGSSSIIRPCSRH
mmetsp:Transcript_32202/g.46464  ORF Transcript_32202/g.46464 Transcript_32202/m.46464 type:complete len:192 (+) Transcript_32202:50-625(+)